MMEIRENKFELLQERRREQGKALLQRLTYVEDFDILQLTRDFFDLNDQRIMFDLFKQHYESGVDHLGKLKELGLLNFYVGLDETIYMGNYSKAMLINFKENYMRYLMYAACSKYAATNDVEEFVRNVNQEFVIDEKVESLKDIVENKKEMQYISTGFPKLDRALSGKDYGGGYLKGSLNLIMGYTSAGKTHTALSIASNIAKQGNHVHVISLEMSKNQLANRFLKIDPNCHQYPITIVDVNSNFDVLVSKIKQLKAQSKIEVLVIDYIQLMMHSARSEYERMNDIAQRLQALTIKLEITILILSQMSNEGAKDSDSGIMYAKGGGTLPASSNSVLIIQNDNKWANKEDFKNAQMNGLPTQVIWNIEKNRDGRKALLKMKFHNMRYEELEDDLPPLFEDYDIKETPRLTKYRDF